MTDLSTILPEWKDLTQDQLAAKVAALPKEIRDELTAMAFQLTEGMKWLPSPGAQLSAYHCHADIMLYGGAAGGGKTQLILGLAMTAHQRSLIMRDEFNALKDLYEKAITINGTRAGFNGSPPPTLRTTDGRFIQFTGAVTEKFQGVDFDLKCFDECAQLSEEVVRFHLAWVRTSDRNQRTRVVMSTNPPVNSQGDWIIGMFRPWLDITHDNPAKFGELRWYAKDPEGNDFEVPDSKPYLFPGDTKPVRPMSRTFIPAKLKDNPYYVGTSYEANLDNLDEPLRSAMRDGNFMASRRDQEAQVIPTSWILAAQKRWTETPPPDLTMTAIGLDVGAGGIDRVVLARRHGEWYAPLITKAGKDAPDGSTQAALVVLHRRDQCGVVVDVGGGYGGDCVNRLKDNSITVQKFDGSAASVGRAKDGSGRIFINKRAEAWWRFREALNPDQPGGAIVALPDDPELRSELSSVCYIPDIAKIQIESKPDVKKRLGRSPDKADAVVMAWAPGDTAIRRVRFGSGLGGQERQERANVGYSVVKAGFRG